MSACKKAEKGYQIVHLIISSGCEKDEKVEKTFKVLVLSFYIYSQGALTAVKKDTKF